MTNTKRNWDRLLPKKGKPLQYKRVRLAAIKDFDPAVSVITEAFEDAGPPWFTTKTAAGRKAAEAELSLLTLTCLQVVSPIIVTVSGSSYWCVAGIHTLNLARLLDPEQKSIVTVVVLPTRLADETRKSLALTDLFIKAAVSAHCWVNPKLLALTWSRIRATGSPLLESLMPGAGSKRGIARIRRVSFNTMFARKNNATKESEQ